MSNRSNFPELDLYLHKVAAAVRERPELAGLAYSRAAAHVRSLATSPKYRGRGFQLQIIAAKLDEYALQVAVPDVDPVEEEIEGTFADDPTGQVMTAFDGVLEDMAEATQHEDGSPGSELYSAARFSQLQKERSRVVANPVQITPENSGDNSNLLGSTVLVQYGGTGGSGSFTAVTGGFSGAVVAKEEAEVIRWSGESRDALPCRISISPLIGGSGATYPTGGNGSNSYSYRPYFRARWGSGERGTAHEVVGDIGRGVQFTVSATNVNVNVGMGAFTPTVAVGPSATYVAGAMYLNANMAFFAGGSAAPVTRTLHVDEIVDDATADLVIPLFAKYLLPVQCTNVTGQSRLDFLDNNSNILYSLLYSNGGLIAPIPISDDAYSVRLTNSSGGTAGYRLVFQLIL